MKSTPILFNTDMVRAVLAVLDGRKTNTRRIMAPQPEFWGDDKAADLVACWYPYADHKKAKHYNSVSHFKKGAPKDFSPYGQPGDLLWVRETWRQAYERTDYSSGIIYKADKERSLGMDEYSDRHKWKPSIHMPKWTSRLTLLIEDIRVERVQDISEEDAKAEGVEASSWEFSCEPYRNYSINGFKPGHNFSTAKKSFESLWQSINGPDSWAKNEWVWVIQFKAIKQNINDYLKAA